MRRLLFFVFVLFSVTSFSYGLLDIVTYPSGARVIVDNIETGYSPVSLDLSSGFHRVSIALNGFETFESYLKVEEDEVLYLKKILHLDSNITASIGSFFYDLEINDFEPAEWLYEKSAPVIEKALDQTGIKVSKDGETKKLLLEVREIKENTFSVTATSVSTGLPFLPPFIWKDIFYVKGLREHYEAAIAESMCKLTGELGSYYQQIYGFAGGNIDIIDVDVSGYPEMKIVFIPLDSTGNAIDDDEISNSKFRILEGDISLDPLGFPGKYSDAGINIVINIESDVKGNPEIKGAIKEFIEYLPPESEFALNSSMSELSPLKNFTVDSAEIINSMNFIGSYQYSTVEDSLKNSFDLLCSNKGANFLLVVSDIKNSPELAGELINRVKTEDLIVLGIGVGEREKFGFLEELAGISGGIFINIKDYNRLLPALDEAFKRINELYEISYTTRGKPGGILRIQTPDRVLESNFVTEKSVVDCEILIPDKIVTGIPFDMTLSSMATATYPLELEITLEGQLNNEVIATLDNFDGFKKLGLMVKNPGDYKLKINASGFERVIDFKAIYISDAMNSAIRTGNYSTARELALTYISTNDYHSKEEYNSVLKQLFDIDFEIAAIKGTFVFLREIVDLTKDNSYINGENMVRGALALAYLGELDRSQKLLASLSTDDYISQDVKALRMIYSVAGDEEERALKIARESDDNIYSPHFLRACGDVLLRAGFDEEARKIAYKISEGDLSVLNSSNIFMIGLLTDDSVLMRRALNSLGLLPGTEELQIAFGVYKEWFFGNRDRAMSLLSEGQIRYSTTPLLIKLEGYMAAYQGNYIAANKAFEDVAFLDFEDDMIRAVLEKNSFGSKLFIETPGVKKIINGPENILLRLRGEGASLVLAEIATIKIPFYRDILSPYLRGVIELQTDKSENLMIKLNDAWGTPVDELSISVVYDEAPPKINSETLVYTSSRNCYISAEFKDDVGLSNGFIGDEKFDFNEESAEKGAYVYISGRSEELILGAADLSGRRTQKKVEIIYDPDKPSIKIYGEPLFREPDSEFKVVVEDNLSLKNVKLNGEDYPVYGQNHVEDNFTISLEPDEIRVISVVAMDSAGNISESTLKIKRDYSPPEFHITSKIHGDFLLVNLKAIDEAGIENIKFGEVVRGFYGLENIETEFEVLFESEITIGAGDSLGNYSERVFEFEPDRIEPEIEYSLDPNDYDRILIDFYDENDLKYVRAGSKLVKLDYEENYRIALVSSELKGEIELIAIDSSDNSLMRKLRLLPVYLLKDYNGYLKSKHIMFEAETDESVEYSISVNGRIYNGKTDTGLISQQITLDRGMNTVKLLMRGENSIGGKIFHMEYFPEKIPLTIRLEWPENAGILNLYVNEPSGNTIYNGVENLGPGKIKRYSKKYEDTVVAVEEYSLNQAGSVAPEPGEYTFRIHCSELLADTGKVNFKVIVDNFGKGFTTEGSFEFANPDNYLPEGTGDDWYDCDEIFYGVGDQERPEIQIDLPEILLSSSNSASITFSIEDNMGLSEIFTGIEFDENSAKYYNIFGKDSYSINEIRVFPEGFSTLYVIGKDVYGLESMEKKIILTDTIPPEIVELALEKSSGKTNVHIKLFDSEGLRLMTLNGQDYFIGDLENIIKEFELTEEIELHESDKNIEIRIKDLVGNETVKIIGW